MNAVRHVASWAYEAVRIAFWLVVLLASLALSAGVIAVAVSFVLYFLHIRPPNFVFIADFIVWVARAIGSLVGLHP
jgi:hypothetical protein